MALISCQHTLRVDMKLIAPSFFFLLLTFCNKSLNEDYLSCKYPFFTHLRLYPLSKNLSSRSLAWASNFSSQEQMHLILTYWPVGTAFMVDDDVECSGAVTDCTFSENTGLKRSYLMNLNAYVQTLDPAQVLRNGKSTVQLVIIKILLKVHQLGIWPLPYKQYIVCTLSIACASPWKTHFSQKQFYIRRNARCPHCGALFLDIKVSINTKRFCVRINSKSSTIRSQISLSQLLDIRKKYTAIIPSWCLILLYSDSMSAVTKYILGSIMMPFNLFSTAVVSLIQDGRHLTSGYRY